MGVVNTTTIPLLLKTILGGKLDPGQLITHRLPFTDVLHAYDLFAHAGQERAVKIVLNVAAQEPAAEADLVELIVRRIMQASGS